MLNQYPIELLVALSIATMFVYSYLDRFVESQGDTIAAGAVRGVPISAKHRIFRLNTRWLPSATAVVAYLGGMAIGWALIGRNAGREDVRLFAYLVAFLSTTTALGWLFQAPFWYFHLASILRQAEAD